MLFKKSKYLLAFTLIFFITFFFVLFRSSNAYMDSTTMYIGIEHRYGNDDRDFSDDTLNINDTNVDLSRYVKNRDGYTVESYSPSQFIDPSQYSAGSFLNVTIYYKENEPVPLPNPPVQDPTPTPPTPTPDPKPVTPPTQNSGKKDSYIYIYYRSVAGHDVLASQTIQGS
ncbi:MAG: S-layer homology domain-containing protein, partial [Peptoanaerobacter stomatis]